MDVKEKYVMQKVNRKEKSICPNCIHHNLCIAENNQPCFECNRFIDAHGVTVQEWISVKDRLPSEEEYIATSEDGTEYYARLLIAYKTDIVEYEIGYYDGHKWMTEMPIRLIKNVVAWMLFPNMPQPPKGE